MIKEVKNLYVLAVNYSEILKFERETWILSHKNKAFLSQYTSALTLCTLCFTFRYNINDKFFGSVIPKEEFGKSIPDGKVNKRNTGTRCEIRSKLTIKTPERHQWRRSGTFIVNFENISHLVLVFLLLTLSS